MHARALERIMATAGGFTSSDGDIRTRSLRGDGRLPLGGRGLAPPELTPQQVAIMLIAFGCVSNASKVSDQIESYMNLISPPSKAKLVDEIAAIIADSEFAGNVTEIRFCRGQNPLVHFKMDDGAERSFYPKHAKVKRYEDLLEIGREEYVFGGGLIHQLAIDFETGQEI